MPFKISCQNQLCQNKLFKCRNSTGVESQILRKPLYKALGQHHIACTQGGRNGFGKGVQIDHVIIFGKGKQRFLRLCGNRKFGFKVIFDKEAGAILCPADVFMPFGCRCGDAGREAPVWGDVQNVCAALSKRGAFDSISTEREKLAPNARRPINLLDFFIGRRFQRDGLVPSQNADNQTV